MNKEPQSIHIVFQNDKILDVYSTYQIAEVARKQFKQRYEDNHGKEFGNYFWISSHEVKDKL